MVSLKYIADAAMRHDTAVAAAFRKALGVSYKRARRIRYKGVRECFRNSCSPMDCDFL